ncbi:hypothetical protein CHS0354_008503 [Potamilus streckersoni]|uniref:Serine/threonine-protein kinase RIO3 n=1 Tax=Potamilus streckersoni TaxID=2493646 RepID=A0AAE0S877_9BIVA|nr:hypothetical protein CHS0354_008503 [Potamilus streckersoni]
MEGITVEHPLPEITGLPSINPWGAKPSPLGNKPSPWGKSSMTNISPPVFSLKDVMSEQLAAELQSKEDWKFHGQNPSSDTMIKEPSLEDLSTSAGEDQDTSNDEILARLLQIELDREHDKQLQAEAKKFNGQNKVSISFENYRLVHPLYRDENEEIPDFDEGYEDQSEWDKKPTKIVVSGKGKQITTKHDAVTCGRRNASKIMEFPPEFESGDGEGMDIRLPNHVYNKLKRHSEAENKKSQKLHEKKEHSTAEHAMDPRTRLLLYKMVNNGILESISGSISTGKESVVFHAFGGILKEIDLPKECAIKVFKTTLNEFRTREKYVHGDHRFSKDDYKKQNPRKIIKIWAEKETANLNRMKKFQIPCPMVQLLRKHILVLSFIGCDQRPAPKLKDAHLSVEDTQIAYEQTLEILKKMHRECGLVHADLSEYNMLWHEDKVWVIDVSQSVEITHPKALEFLYRDCTNVSRFFEKQGAHDVLSAENIFNMVTGLNLQGEGSDFLAQVQKYDKEKSEELLAHQVTQKEYAFDFFFEKALKEREAILQEMGFSDSAEEDVDDGQKERVVEGEEEEVENWEIEDEEDGEDDNIEVNQ